VDQGNDVSSILAGQGQLLTPGSCSGRVAYGRSETVGSRIVTQGFTTTLALGPLGVSLTRSLEDEITARSPIMINSGARLD
jgi:hypothetical protein